MTKREAVEFVRAIVEERERSDESNDQTRDTEALTILCDTVESGLAQQTKQRERTTEALKAGRAVLAARAAALKE